MPLGEVLKEIGALTKTDFPPQINGKIIGTAAVFAGSFKSLNFLILLALFVIYVLLGILYESFIPTNLD